MIKAEYKLVKWLNGGYKKLPITIQQDAVADFCEIIGWDKEKFANNTIRYPIEVEDIDVDNEEREPEEEKPIKPFRDEMPKKKKKVGNYPIKFTSEIIDFVRKKSKSLPVRELVEELKEEFDFDTTENKLAAMMYYRKIKIFKRRVHGFARKELTKSRRRKFPPEMVDFIQKNVDMNNSELSEEISKRFKIDMTVKQISDFMRYWKIKKGQKPKEKSAPEKEISKPGITSQTFVNLPAHKINQKVVKSGFTEDQLEFIKNNWKNKTDKELRQAMGNGLGMWPRPENIEKLRRKMGWTRKSEREYLTTCKNCGDDIYYEKNGQRPDECKSCGSMIE